jgi:hypothetical protein
MAGPKSNALRCKEYYHRHRDRIRGDQKEYYEANKPQRLASNRKLRYGITQEEFDRMLEKQGRVCRICSTDVPGGRGTWKLDHSHVTNAIRGILCHHCNIMLGCAKDLPELLIKAAEYLVS